MLERNPAKRYASAAEARQALLQSQPEGFLPRTLVADFLSDGTVRRPTARAAARTRKSTLPLRAASLAILAVIGVVLVYYFSKVSQTPSEKPPEVALQPDSTRPTVPPPDTTLAADTTTPGTVVQTPPRIPPAGNSPPDTTPVVRRPDTTVVAVSSEPGFVDLSCRPWASVYLGDSLVGTTPLPGVLTLPPGRHNLVLLNPEIGLPISRTVTVVGGKTAELHINLLRVCGPDPHRFGQAVGGCLCQRQTRTAYALLQADFPAPRHLSGDAEKPGFPGLHRNPGLPGGRSHSRNPRRPRPAAGNSLKILPCPFVPANCPTPNAARPY